MRVPPRRQRRARPLSCRESDVLPRVGSAPSPRADAATIEGPLPTSRGSSRIVVAIVALALAGVGGVLVGALGAGATTRSPDSGSVAAVTSSGPTPSTSPRPSASPSPTPVPTPTPAPTPTTSPTPEPTPVPVPAPLTGRLVRPDVAARHPIAVMIDDHADARPQSGFNDAAVVWHAPAEGGIPRYMLIFQDRVPPSVGPVRSARQYYIAWAAEWDAVYAHAGGSPQALDTLRRQGNGQLVYNADEFRWGGVYFHRTKDRFAPHNVYTSGKELRKLAKRLGAKDGARKTAWRFAPDAALVRRPKGGKISFAYSHNAISYRYDRETNTYPRSVTGQEKQIDRGTDTRVAPKNVVIMLMSFGPLNDGSKKHRLEARFVGRGTAWIATNGKTIKGTWRKDSITKPTRFFDAGGKAVTLTIGQTFVQVVPNGTRVAIKDGKVPVRALTPMERRLELP